MEKAPAKRPEVPRVVVQKLIAFSVAMIILPLTTFFLFQGLGAGPIWSGGVAALVANIVLIGYVVVAFTEDLGPVEPSLEAKKNQ